MTILLDAAGTLIRPAEPVGQVYARHLASAAGLQVDSARMDSAFRAVFAAALPPDYSLHPFGHAAEHAWWRDLVAGVLQSLGGEAATFAAESSTRRPAPHRQSRLPGGNFRPPLDHLPATPERPPTAAQGDEGTFDHFFHTLFTHFAQPSAWTLFPEVLSFLNSASRLGPLAVLSNFDDRLPAILDGLGIGPCFEHVFTSADARARKPDRALFDLALDRLNSAPAETAHCGDSLGADFHGATAAGLRAFHLQRPAQSLLDFLEFCRS